MLIATNIKTRDWYRIAAFLVKQGWQVGYKYDNFDAGIDADFIMLVKEYDLVTMGWDNWAEGEIKCSEEQMKWIESSLGLTFKFGEPVNLKRKVIAQYRNWQKEGLFNNPALLKKILIEQGLDDITAQEHASSTEQPHTVSPHHVILYEFQAENLCSSAEMYFNEKDELVFAGYDIGKTVEELKGDSDYEYNYTIPDAEADKLRSLLGVNTNDKDALLVALKIKFATDHAYSELGEFMRANNIVYTSSTW